MMASAMNPMPADMAMLPRSDSVLPYVVGTTMVFYILALLTFILRIYSRTRPYMNLGWDDYIMSLAMLLGTGDAIVQVAVVSYTGGRHTMYISHDKLVLAAKVGFLGVPMWVWSMTVLKISVALMLLRIKETRKWRIGIWSLIAALAALGFGSTMAMMLQCRPIQANWNVFFRLKPGVCWSAETQEAVTFTTSGVYFFSLDNGFALIKLIHSCRTVRYYRCCLRSFAPYFHTSTQTTTARKNCLGDTHGHGSGSNSLRTRQSRSFQELPAFTRSFVGWS
jgi:hypothetical protein